MKYELKKMRPRGGRTTVQLDTQLMERVHAFARGARVTAKSLVQVAIAEYLDRQEGAKPLSAVAS